MLNFLLLPPSPQKLWLDKFRTHLMRLQPGMNTLDAAHEAVSIYPDAADMDPEEAAEIFALE